MLRGVVEKDRASSGFDFVAKVGRAAVCRDRRRRVDDIVVDREAEQTVAPMDYILSNTESRASRGKVLGG